MRSALRSLVLAALWPALLEQVGCAAGPPPGAPPSAPGPAADPSAVEELDRLAGEYFEELLAIDPILASSMGDRRYNDRFTPPFMPEIRARARSLHQRTLAGLTAIDPERLDPGHRLTWEVLRDRLERADAERRYPAELLPLDHFNSFTAAFVEMGSGTGVHPFRTVEDYDDFLARARGFVAATDVAIANLRRGAATGVTLPRVVVERLIPQLDAQLVADARQSVFHQPVARMPGSFPAAERARLAAAYEAAIAHDILPAYRRLRDFLRDEYLTRARPTVGWSALPEGRAWYEAILARQTTTDLGADRIHEIGLAEVARLRGEIERLREEVGFRGSLNDFLTHMRTEPRFLYGSREEMLADYRAAKSRIDASTDRLFDLKPRADYEIRPVEAFRERSAAPGSYVAASPDGSRPGVFYLNTYEPTTRSRTEKVTILLHEGSPGHHFQISLQRERADLPGVRRSGGFGAFVEGWGLYSETLGPELGVYTDPYDRYGALNWELWRAVRMVLDTGIHARGWTREQAIEYARANSSQGEPTIVQEVERFIAYVGQAPTYKVGEMKIRELRARAEAALGDRFDVKAFHRAVLEDGALPLGVLEAKIDRWIAERRRAIG